MRTPLAIAALLACAIPLPALGADADLSRATARGRQLSEWFQAGNLDSLLGAAPAFDLSGPGDSVVARWVRDKGVPIPSSWPEAPATLEGREGMVQLFELSRNSLGPASTVVDEATYWNHRVPGEANYIRVLASGSEKSSATLNWTIRSDGSSLGGWLFPTPDAGDSLEGYKAKTRLRLPFQGEWMVLQGGRKPYENEHLFQEPLRYACDFVVVRENLSFSGAGDKNSDHYAYGLPIVAPAAGKVTMAADTFDENVPPHQPPGYRGPGNFVMIDHGNGEYSVLAHLRKGSVRVKQGDRVNAGEKIGECGNNGQSTEPHLHYQLQLSPRPGGKVIPAVFRDYWADGVRVKQGEPRKGQHVRAN